MQESGHFMLIFVGTSDKPLRSRFPSIYETDYPQQISLLGIEGIRRPFTLLTFLSSMSQDVKRAFDLQFRRDG